MKKFFITNPIPNQISAMYIKHSMMFLVLSFCNLMNANPDDWHSSDRMVIETEFTAVGSMISCMGFVQVSLDQFGNANLTAKMFLVDTTSNPGKFKAFISGTGATSVHCSDIGKNLTVTVLDTISRQSCWSTLRVEDKLKPQVICLNDTLYCTQDPFGIDYTNFILATDNCDTDIYSFYDIRFERFDCSNLLFTSVVHLTWTFIDNYNNISNCSQDIYFAKAPIDSIVFPLDDTLFCPSPNLDLAGVPLLFGDTVSHMCNLLVTHTDDTIPVCGGMVKVLRTWTVMDWCTGERIMDTQNILVSDTSRPNIICPRDTILFAGTKTCNVLFTIPSFSATDDCSPANQIFYAVRIDSFNFSRPGQVVNLAVGMHTLEYIAIDPCGNSDTCIAIANVLDKFGPNIVCPPRLVLSLSALGVVSITANHLSNLGYITDNCGIDTILIRRMTFACGRPQDTLFTDEIQFCCEDVGTFQQVVLLAVDPSGNANICMIEIEIQDKNIVTIVCPSDITIQCDEDYTDLNVTGFLIFTSACTGGSIVSHIDSLVAIDSCKEGRVIRKFYVMMSSGAIDSSCRQIITIENPFRLQSSSIIWPRDTTINACRNQSPDSLGRPIVLLDICSSVYISFIQSPTMIRNDSCRFYFRYWTALQSCSSRIILRDTQEINLLNSFAPIVTAPLGIISNTRQDSCARFVNVIATLVLRCNTGVTITNNITPNGLDASAVYPVGDTRVIFTVTDACNNISRDTTNVVILDLIAPEVTCRLLDTIMPSGGQIKLRPKDLLTSAMDNCTPNDRLVFSFNPVDVNDTCRIITCDSLTMDPDTLRWQVAVFDSSGNVGICNVTIVVRDPNNVCPGLIRMGIISGLVSTVNGVGMSNVEMQLSGTNMKTITDKNGKYDFGIIETNKSYDVVPLYSSTDWSTGLTTEDITRIQDHILQKRKFKGPYQFFAADVDRNGRITAYDINLLRQLILGKMDNILTNTSWRFLNSHYAFHNPAEPLLEIEKDNVELRGFWRNAVIDLFAIKVGDVSGASGLQNVKSRIRDVGVEIEDRQVASQEVITVAVRMDENVEIEGFQFGFLLNKLEVLEIEEYLSFEHSLELGQEYYHVKDGKLIISFNNAEAKKLLNGNNLIRLTLRSKTSGLLSQLLQLDPARVNEVYPMGDIPSDIRLTYISKLETQQSAPKNWTVDPNPFEENCFISFDSEMDTQGSIDVYNLNGGTVYSQSIFISQGNNTWIIRDSDLPGNGTYLYKAHIGPYIKSGKIVRTK